MVQDEGGEDLYSMQELEKDLKKVKGGRRALWLFVGLALGVAGTLALPPLVRPYLPEALRGGTELLSGLVLEEEREGDRLLLTVDGERGALIASFTRRVSEIGLLVAPGDSVTLAVPDYEPFLEDPEVESIRKARPGASGPALPIRGPAGPAGDDSATIPSGDSAGADTAEAGGDAGETAPAPADSAAQRLS